MFKKKLEPFNLKHFIKESSKPFYFSWGILFLVVNSTYFNITKSYFEYGCSKEETHIQIQKLENKYLEEHFGADIFRSIGYPGRTLAEKIYS